MGWPCIIWFLATVVIVSLVVLNLFLALLLSSFDAMSDYTPDADSPAGVSIAFKRIACGISFLFQSLRKCCRWTWAKICCCCCSAYCLGKKRLSLVKPNETTHIDINEGTVKGYNTRVEQSTVRNGEATVVHANNNGADNADKNSAVYVVDEDHVKVDVPTPAAQNGDIFVTQRETPSNANEDEWSSVESFQVQFEQGTVRCFPDIVYLKFPWLAGNDTELWKRWIKLRSTFYDIIEHQFFEHCVTVLIILSSVALCFEDVHLDKPDWKMVKDALKYADIIFTAIFIAEMMAKWLGLGLVRYFTNPWYWLDFITITFSVVSFFQPQLKFLRVLRALRPLRIISRWEGMRIVVNSLVFSIPAIFNVFLVCLMFWLIFAIAGVQLFKGKGSEQ